MSQNNYLTLDCEALAAPASYVGRVHELLSLRYESLPLACVHCYGCQQSVADGEKLKGLLAEMGYGFTEILEEADLVLYNTCAVRESAEQRVFGNVGELKHYKQRRPSMIIAISGCMTAQQHVVDKLARSYKHVDIVVGTNAFAQLPQLIYDKLTSNSRGIVTVGDSPTSIVEGIPTRRDGTIKARVPIMYGCDNYCAYCIVPYVRGRERSRASSVIVAEVAELVADGYRDITLLGQNVNSYGKGLPERVNFSGLLRMINDIEGDFCIRFMTSHPKDCTHELIDTMATCSKVTHHLHLPVQSGSNRVLAAMNRHYTVEQYIELINYARARIPDINITSDIIVGFPGESYEDFTETMELVRRVGYTSLFTFIYSRRSGTRAVELPDPVPQADKSRWLRELLAVQATIGNDIMRSYIGSTMLILVEGEGKSKGIMTSRNGGNIIVELQGDASLAGQFVQVRIQDAMNWALKGELVK